MKRSDAVKLLAQTMAKTEEDILRKKIAEGKAIKGASYYTLSVMQCLPYAEAMLEALEEAGMTAPPVFRHGFTTTAVLREFEEDITDSDWDEAFRRGEYD